MIDDLSTMPEYHTREAGSGLPDGMLLVYKPAGPTSHDIVNAVRRKTGVKRVGHAGTLDPFASGLLIVLVGREATKRQSEFLTMDKTYEAVIRLGATSTTDDRTGHTSPSQVCQYIDTNLIEQAVASFVGSYEQYPPQFSAKKIKGTPAYKFARAGKAVELKPKKVTSHSIEILSYEWPILSVRMTVSSGTYIRAFARDLGAKLDCGGYVEELKRTAIGPYSLENATSIDLL